MFSGDETCVECGAASDELVDEKCPDCTSEMDMEKPPEGTVMDEE